MLTSSALVLMMTLPGLALFYGGLVRGKNVLSVLMQCAISAGLVGVLWVLAGYSLAFPRATRSSATLSKAGLAGITKDTLWLTIPEYVFVAFQGMFAIITPALMLGAFRRAHALLAYLAFIAIWLFAVTCRSRTWSGAAAGSAPTSAPRTSRAGSSCTCRAGYSALAPRSCSGRAAATARSRCRRTTCR
jgi:Amt family ammonium transporter